MVQFQCLEARLWASSGSGDEDNIETVMIAAMGYNKLGRPHTLANKCGVGSVPTRPWRTSADITCLGVVSSGTQSWLISSCNSLALRDWFTVTSSNNRYMAYQRSSLSVPSFADKMALPMIEQADCFRWLRVLSNSNMSFWTFHNIDDCQTSTYSCITQKWRVFILF